LLKQPREQIELLSSALTTMRNDIQYCKECNTISDAEICGICSSASRDKTIICVVEDVRDVMAIENTGMYKGIYHVLGGKISPIEGIGPSQLKISSLVEKVKEGKVLEIIFALSSTMEGDTTNFYIYRQLKEYDVKTSTIARGIAVGDELEYADEVTLGRSLLNRIPFEGAIKQ
jgi:recombination protein RecR